MRERGEMVAEVRIRRERRGAGERRDI